MNKNIEKEKKVFVHPVVKVVELDNVTVCTGASGEDPVVDW